jgi:hypothetical protein
LSVIVVFLLGDYVSIAMFYIPDVLYHFREVLEPVELDKLVSATYVMAERISKFEAVQRD